MRLQTYKKVSIKDWEIPLNTAEAFINEPDDVTQDLMP